MKTSLRQAGFTMIELMVTIALFTVVLVFSAEALSRYLAVQSLDAAVREITVQIKEAQQMAEATGNTYRIDFSDPEGASYQLSYRQGSGAWTNARSPKSLPRGVYFDQVSFGEAPGYHNFTDCFARGSCEDGELRLVSRRFGASGLLKTVYLQGETVNVTAN